MFTVETDKIRFDTYLVLIGNCWVYNMPNALESITDLLVQDANEISR